MILGQLRWENIKHYFDFCLTPGPNYLVQYAAATYLSPQHKFVLSASELQLVKEYLSSKDIEIVND